MVLTSTCFSACQPAPELNLAEQTANQNQTSAQTFSKMTVLSTLTSPLTSALHLAQGVGNGAVNLAKDTIVLVGGTVAGNPVVGKVLEKGLIR